MKQTKIAIAGATGFIGKNLISSLLKNSEYAIVALSRKKTIEDSLNPHKSLEWRKCDGFNAENVFQATRDCDVLVYLIHSMLPSASLSQGKFEDYDLIVADNFSKAAKQNNIKHIIYLSGLIPNIPVNTLSDHLRSRLEVEHVLAQYSNVTTTLRAGLIIGKNGSSYTILEKLIKRLPILLCPQWTKNNMHPIALKNVIEALHFCLKNLDQLKNKTFDIGTVKPTSYKNLLITTAKIFNLKRLFIPIPLLSTTISKFWVTLVTGASKELVFPLVASLEYDMVVDEKKRLLIPHQQLLNDEDALKVCTEGKTENLISFKSISEKNQFQSKDVISIQRVPNLFMINALDLGILYFQWLKTYLFFLISITEDNEAVYIKIFSRIILLKMLKPTSREASDSCSSYIIQSGLLVHKENRDAYFEFRKIPSAKCFIIGVYNYRPSLPWFVYRFTQALVHLFIMKRFIKWSKRNTLLDQT